MKNNEVDNLIDIDNIVFVESVQSYAYINYIDGRILISENSLGELKSELPGEKFIRINESYIINADYVKKIRLGYPKKIIMHQNHEIEVNHFQYKELIQFLKYSYVI